MNSGASSEKYKPETTAIRMPVSAIRTCPILAIQAMEKAGKATADNPNMI